jgi:hypothetical protein
VTNRRVVAVVTHVTTTLPLPASRAASRQKTTSCEWRREKWRKNEKEIYLFRS